MTVNNKAVTWPYAYKTIAMSTSNAMYTFPYGVYNSSLTVLEHSELALQIYPPLYIYETVGLYMHLDYTFSTVVATQDQVLLGIYVRDTSSSYIREYGSAVQNYMPLNIQANANRNINVSLDLSSLITGLTNNVVFLVFDPNCAESQRTIKVGDDINLWKLDLVYQTITVRDEK